MSTAAVDKVNAPVVSPSYPLQFNPSKVTAPAKFVAVSPSPKVTSPPNFTLVAAPATKPLFAPKVPESRNPVAALSTVSAARFRLPRPIHYRSLWSFHLPRQYLNQGPDFLRYTCKLDISSWELMSTAAVDKVNAPVVSPLICSVQSVRHRPGQFVAVSRPQGNISAKLTQSQLRLSSHCLHQGPLKVDQSGRCIVHGQRCSGSVSQGRYITGAVVVPPTCQHLN